MVTPFSSIKGVLRPEGRSEQGFSILGNGENRICRHCSNWGDQDGVLAIANHRIGDRPES
ncbi:MAG: hypothetical protein VKJ64_12365 [Leptolyngbyaceae bacterium]|nr:hypothetical protein [Leptolyngbyaceae bacterium]